MEESCSNIQAVWHSTLESVPDAQFLKLPAPASTQILSYRLTSFYKRSARIANALRDTLRLSEGTRVAVLTDSINDFALLLHGIWLARCVVVPIDLSTSTEETVRIVNSLNVETVIFPPEASARVASMFSQTSAVDNWVVTGSSTTMGSSGVVRRLDELTLTAAMDVSSHLISDEDCDALIVSTNETYIEKDPKKALFTQKQLVAAALTLAELYPTNVTPGQLAWSGLRWGSFNGLLHSFLVPLFTGLPALVNDESVANRFWDYTRANNIACAAIDLASLRIINRQGKPRNWQNPKNLKIFLYTDFPLASSVMELFQKRFGLPIYTSYSKVEAGGLITTFPRNVTEEYIDQWIFDYEIPSSGTSVSGADFFVADSSGQQVGEETVGEIFIRSSYGMKGYTAPHPTDSARTPSPIAGYRSTGDEGFFACDNEGRKHLFVLDRIDEVIVRADQRINPARIDSALFDIQGIEFGRAVGFPNLVTGIEIGAYVVLLRASHLREEDIVKRLQKSLDWSECPKVIILGERSIDGRYPYRKDLEDLFEEYYGIDFSQPGYYDGK